MPVASDKTVTDVVTDFLASGAALAEIAAYRLPDDLQIRAHELLEKNRTGSLTDEERAEIEEFREIDHILTLVKAKARLKLLPIQ
ncbi:MAG: hypothetical protein GC179_20435 [Anaerolineaceae bacterium]|nr:hypothetical protein [Anaerolineaceae bacterium]